MKIDKPGVYKTREGFYRKIVLNESDRYWRWKRDGVTDSSSCQWNDNGEYRKHGIDSGETKDDLIAYICPLYSIAPPEVHKHYRELGYLIREVGEMIKENDYMYVKGVEFPPAPIPTMNIGDIVESSDGNYYLEPLPSMESTVRPIPESQGTAEAAISKGEFGQLRGAMEQYQQNWLALQEAVGEQCLNVAIEKVKEWKAMYDSKPKIPTPGTLVRYDSEKCYVGVDPDGNAALQLCKHNSYYPTDVQHLFLLIEPPETTVEFQSHTGKWKFHQRGDDDPVVTKVEG